MPKGVPVATVAVDAAANAGILAAQILATAQPDLLDKIKAFKTDLIDQVNGMIDEVEGWTYERIYAAPKPSCVRKKAQLHLAVVALPYAALLKAASGCPIN